MIEEVRTFRRAPRSSCAFAVRCGMPALVFLTAMMLPAAALAQAPVEDRGVGGGSFGEAQQRVEFARQAAEQADRRVLEAEAGARAADGALASAQRQLVEARAGTDKARKDLEQARARARELRKAYEREATQFERVRRGAGPR